MLQRYVRRLGLAVTALSLALTTAACGTSNTPSTGGVGDNPPQGNAEAGYAVKADLCAEADLAPIKAIFPVVKDLKPQDKIYNGAPIYYCDGGASKSNAYDDIGFLSMAAYLLGSTEEATTEYERIAGSTYMTDKQPVAGIGQKAISYADGPAVRVSAVDGRFYFVIGWTPNGGASKALLKEVRQALVDTAKATMAKLKTA